MDNKCIACDAEVPEGYGLVCPQCLHKQQKGVKQMENEIRYYLKQIKEAITTAEEPYPLHYIITAVKLPTGAIEIAVNDEGILDKIDYILNAYDDDMHLKTNQDVVMQNIMIV